MSATPPYTQATPSFIIPQGVTSRLSLNRYYATPSHVEPFRQSVVFRSILALEPDHFWAMDGAQSDYTVIDAVGDVDLDVPESDFRGFDPNTGIAGFLLGPESAYPDPDLPPVLSEEPTATPSFLLLEDGDDLLLEDGDQFILDQPVVYDVGFTLMLWMRLPYAADLPLVHVIADKNDGTVDEGQYLIEYKNNQATPTGELTFNFGDQTATYVNAGEALEEGGIFLFRYDPSTNKNSIILDNEVVAESPAITEGSAFSTGFDTLFFDSEHLAWMYAAAYWGEALDDERVETLYRSLAFLDVILG